MTGRTSLTIVLAAGEGTRMQSAMPKVLHPVAGQSLLAHVLDAAPKGAGASLAVVIGPDHRAVAEEVKRLRPDATTFIQRERLGTAHAVLAARDAIARGADDLLVVFGDTPLISAATLARMRAPLKNGAALAVLGFQAADPTGYGRLLFEGDRLAAIRDPQWRERLIADGKRCFQKKKGNDFPCTWRALRFWRMPNACSPRGETKVLTPPI